MSKFNPGDKVKCIKDGGNKGIKTGEIYTIKKCWTESVYECVTLEENTDQYSLYFADRFELVKNPIDEAVKLLESQGYTVIKPKPDFQPGQIWINTETSAKIIILKLVNSSQIWIVRLGETSFSAADPGYIKSKCDPVSGPGLDK